ncbi:MAG: glycosyltransferase family 39 protein [Clostridiales bacterium]|nr:glycosyltransferase family 39 protein [Clostridiales bacterium]
MPNPTKAHKFNYTNAIIITILALFAAISIYNIWQGGWHYTLGDFSTYNNDDVKYLRSAETLLKSGILSYRYPLTPTVFIMPGIIFALLPFVATFGQQGAVLPFKIFQIILQTLNLFLIYKIAKHIFNKKIAIISMLISLVYVADYYASTLILTEVIFRTLFLLLMYFSTLALERGTAKMYIISGIIWSIAILFRPTIAAFPAVIFIMWLIRKVPFTTMLKNGAIVLGIMLVFLTPWWVRNAIVFHEFIPLTVASGNPMLQGTYIMYDQSTDDGLDYSQFEYTQNELVDDRLESAIAKFRLKNLFPANPLGYINWYTIGKTVYQWVLPFVWTPTLGLTIRQIAIEHIIIVIAFLLGLALCLCTRDKSKWQKWYLFITILYFNCIHLPFYAFSRYIYPVMSLCIMFAAYLLYWIYKKLTLIVKAR